MKIESMPPIGRGDPRGYYACLDLPLTAGPEDIRRAFNERAKQLHPDRSDRGDSAAFQRLVDAYGVLRDPMRRLRYDAESVEMSRDDPAEPSDILVADPLAHAWSPTLLWQHLRWKANGLASMAALLVLLAGSLVWGLYQRAGLQEAEERVSALIVSGESARADLAEARARSRAADVAPVTASDGLAQAPAMDFLFPPGSSEMNSMLEGQLSQAVENLAAAGGRVRPEDGWVVVLRGAGGGADAAASRLLFARLSRLSNRLIQAGLPADRWSLGVASGPVGSAPAGAIQLRLLCCFK